MYAMQLVVGHELDRCVGEDADQGRRVTLQQSSHARLCVDVLARAEDTQPCSYDAERNEKGISGGKREGRRRTGILCVVGRAGLEEDFDAVERRY